MQQTEGLETQYKTNLNKEDGEVLHLLTNRLGKFKAAFPKCFYYIQDEDHIFLNTGKSKRIHIICIIKPPTIFVEFSDNMFAGKSIRYGKGVK